MILVRYSMIRRALARFGALALLSMIGPSDSREQEPVRSSSGFDISRAWIADSTLFVPFLVEETRSLRGALEDGVINSETPLLVVERESARLALLTEQLTYHHLAQGQIGGEPWMVSF